MPPGPCNVYARLDGRYGPDDHTQWPQPFSQSAPYLCCIPDGQAPADSIMWWNPTYGDFESTPLRNGIGFLPHRELQRMEECYERLNQRVEKYQGRFHPNNGHPVICPLSVSLRRTLSRLRTVAMTRREVLFECQQVQRQLMELRAIMDYIEIYEPHMDGRVPPAKETANVVSCFVREPHVAERLFSAGIPYWFICPVTIFSTENILSMTTIIQPMDVLESDDYFKPFPRIYASDSNYNRFCAISEHGLKSLRYTDPFSDGNHKGIKPLDFAQTANRTVGPSRGRRDTSARSPPCKLLFFDTLSYLSLDRSSA